MSSYLKLTLPDSALRSKDAEHQEQMLVEVFEKFHFKIKMEGARQKISEEYEDPIFERVFKIESHKEFDATLLQAIKEFQHESEKIDYRHRATILCPYSELFEQKLICTLPPIPANRIMFGNIHDNQFFNHWQVSFGAPRALNVHFEFDKPQPVTVDYCTFKSVPWTRRMVTEKTKISMDGESIQKIIVDLLQSRLYFVLNFPVRINIIHDKYPPRRALKLMGSDGNSFSSEEVLTESPIFCVEISDAPNQNQNQNQQFYSILSRLHQKLGYLPIEFVRVSDYESPISKYKEAFDVNDTVVSEFLKIFDRPEHREEENEERKFTYAYLIQALFSRGSVVKDQLLLNQKNWLKFLKIIESHYNDDPLHFLCEAALEDLLNHVDSTQPRVGNLIETFERFCNARKTSRMDNQITCEEWEQNYRRVRKIILTPTRKILLIPETIMGNRALAGADPDGTHIIRITFRDDSGQPMRYNALQKLLKDTVRKWLREGFKILDREFGFLGCSNSQMRESGAYFMVRYSKQQKEEYIRKNHREPPYHFKPRILEYRERLGKFEDVKSIPLVVSRMGQCFTQARVCNVKIKETDYIVIPDTIRGKYNFTDGIGKISVSLAKRISISVGIKSVPSAFQIRFRGFKGMLAVDPTLTEYHIVFRDSQLKFKDADTNQVSWPIELVKYSLPSPLTLNRPFINILDQVSESQSPSCHLRIIKRIEELLDIETNEFSKFLLDEHSCRAKLAEFPRRIHFSSSLSGFSMTKEPFFRAIIKSYIDLVMMRLANKIQIQIPTDLGRSMFGVTDETGKLKEGQVFVRYTNNINTKHPSETTASSIVTGPIMVTKFPATVPGDVRMLQAIDIPELHHHRDVIVFPQSGLRPHPDEMAGSDLDGDEYAVIWDKQLFLEWNEAAFEYCSEKPAMPFEKEDMDFLMHESVAEYIEKENVGQISVNHFLQSDQWGLNAPVCLALAKKNSQALDFPKSGVAPALLTTQWKNGKAPERAERHPDFWNSLSKLPIYLSKRLLGSLSRELRLVKDVIETSVATPIEVIPDNSLTHKNWKNFQQSAELTMNKYNSQIKMLMDKFGIKSEAELFSGSFKELRCRFSEREADNMSPYNTEMVIEQKVTKIFREARENFFDEFWSEPTEKAFMMLTEPMNELVEDELQDDVLRRVCRNPTEEMKAKAVAYYRVCYENAANSHRKLLSFAWIAFDILNIVKLQNPDISYQSDIPHLPMITKFRNDLISGNPEKFQEFQDKLHQFEGIREYLKTRTGLEKHLFLVEMWARGAGLANEKEAVKLIKLTILAILIAEKGRGMLKSNNSNQNIKISSPFSPTPLILTDTDLDLLTFQFFHYLASREFKTTKIYTCLDEKLILAIHKAGVTTYYNLLLNSKIDELSKEMIKEGSSFVMDLPKNVNISRVLKNLRKKSKCTEIEVRLESKRQFCDRYLISFRGTIVANNELRELVAVELPPNWNNERDGSGEFAQLCYQKILQ